jgi:hypothetical protein
VGDSEASSPNRDTPGPPRQHREHPHDTHVTRRALAGQAWRETARMASAPHRRA